MEYSLTRLQNYSNNVIQEITLQEIIEKLNMIGFEIDNVNIQSFYFSEKIQVLIKIPSNREDLLIEKNLLKELSMLFLFDLYKKWEGLKKSYSFLLKQKYLHFFSYKQIKIDSNLSSLLVYILKLKTRKYTKKETSYFSFSSSPLWVQEKLLDFAIVPKKNYQDVIELINYEWGQSFTISSVFSFKQNLIGNTLLVDESTKNELIDTIEKIVPKSKELHFSLEKIEKKISSSPDNPISFEFLPGTILLTEKENQSNVLSFLGNNKKEIKATQKNLHLIDKKLAEIDEDFFINGIFYDIYENPLQLNSLKTNISYRSLRKTFLENFKFSFQRLLTLFEIIYNISIDSEIYIKNEKTIQLKNEKIIKLNFLSFFQFLNIQKENINFSIFEKASLKKICLTKNDCYFSIPSSRNDLTREIDLIEEYCRFFGYKNIKEIRPFSLKKKEEKKQKKNKRWIKQFFLINNFFELLTNSLDEKKNENKNSIFLKNPLRNEFSVLRTSLLPKIFEIFELNLRTNIERKNYFEIGRVFLKEKKKIKEIEKIAGLFQLEKIKKTKIPNQEWFLAKTFLEKFCFSFGYKKITFESVFSDESYSVTTKNLKNFNSIHLFHPKNTIFFKYENTYLGIFGQLNSIYDQNYPSKYATYLFEFNLLAFPFSQLKTEIKPFVPFSKYPTITKDFSFLIQKNSNFSEIKTEIWKESKFLKKIEFFDIYFDTTSINTVYIGIRLVFQSMTETLTNEIVENEIMKLKIILIKQFKVEFKE